jgi:CHAD domain-containing protein
MELINKNLKKVVKQRKHLTSDRKLHKIRIKLKAVYELLKILNTLNPDLKEEHLKTHKEIKVLNDLLGNWHDQSVLINSLKLFKKESDKGNQQKAIKKSVRAFEHEQLKIKKKILKKLDHLINNRLSGEFEFQH